MTILLTKHGELIFNEPDLKFKKAIEKHKDKLERAILKKVNLKGAILKDTILDKSE